MRLIHSSIIAAIILFYNSVVKLYFAPAVYKATFCVDRLPGCRPGLFRFDAVAGLLKGGFFKPALLN